MNILYLLIIIHSSGNEIVGDYPSKLACDIERANLIEARNFKPQWVKCVKSNVTTIYTK